MDGVLHNTFALYLMVGAALGLVWSWQRVVSGNPHRMSERQIETYQQFLVLGAVVLLAGGLVGARLGYVFLHWGYYSSHTNEILHFSAGGLDWGGVLPGAAICLFFLCGLTDRSPLPLLGDLLPFFTLALVGLWMAAPGASVYYGQEHEAAWWTTSILDQMSEVHTRIPLPMVGLVLSVLWSIGSDLFLPVRLTAIRFEWYGVGQMLILLGASFLRADPVPPLLGMPADRVFAILYLILFLAIGAWRIRAYRRRVVLA